MKVTIEFAGELETVLNDKKKRIEIDLPEREKIKCSELISHIVNTKINNEKKSLFICDS